MRTHTPFSFLLAVLAMAIMLVAARPAAAQPAPTDLGVLPGYTYSEACAINASGQVAGKCVLLEWYQNPNDPSQQWSIVVAERAFIWLPAPAYGLTAGMHDLGEVTGFPDSIAVDINDLGQVAGDSSDGNHRHPFLWLPAPAYGLPAGMNRLTTLNDEVESYVMDLNNAGQVVGNCAVDTGGDWPVWSGYIWQNGVATQLTLDGSTPISCDGEIGKSLNENGQVLGRYKDAVTPTNPWPIDRAVRWENGTAVILTPAGIGTEPVAINEQGEVVGRYGEGREVFLWLPQAAYGLTAGCHQLATEAQFSVANQIFVHDINDNGQIIGSNSFGSIFVDGAWVQVPGALWRWENGTFTGLGTINSDVQQFTINASGQAAGTSLEMLFDDEWNYLGNVLHAHYWSDVTGLLSLDSLEGGDNKAVAINDDGIVAGMINLLLPDNTTALRACIWGAEAPQSTLDISILSVARRNNKTVTLTVEISNPGTETAYAVTVTTATLNDLGTSSLLPLDFGAIKPGTSKKCTLQFKGVPSEDCSLTVQGTCTLGDFFSTQTVTVP